MTFEEYQKQAITTDISPGKGHKVMSIAFMDKVLGLVGESGEIAEKFKKILRDQNGELTEHNVKELTKELGDVLWYIALVAHYMKIDLDDIASKNIAKLKDRQKRGALSGSGDNR